MIKKKPTMTNKISIAILIDTISISDFPTAFVPMKLIPVNISIIAVAIIFR